MNFQQSDLDLMKREVAEFGVEALLTPEALRLLISDLEEARAALRTCRNALYIENEARSDDFYAYALDEADKALGA